LRISAYLEEWVDAICFYLAAFEVESEESLGFLVIDAELKPVV